MFDQESTIRRRAYEIWEAEGAVHGYDQDHWFRAESEVTAPRSRQALKAAPAPRKRSTAAKPRTRKAASPVSA